MTHALSNVFAGELQQFHFASSNPRRPHDCTLFSRIVVHRANKIPIQLPSCETNEPPVAGGFFWSISELLRKTERFSQIATAQLADEVCAGFNAYVVRIDWTL
jgi:hypothetical protein